MANERILVADDHDSLRRGLARALRESGHEVDEAANGNAAIELLHKGQFDVVLSDLKMGGSDGLDVLRTAKALHPTSAVILMTGFGSVNTAVEAMKIGAFDYVQKPFEIEEMELRIQKALNHRRLQHEIDYLRHTQPDIYDFDRIVGASGALQRVLNIVKKVAQSNTTVLIRGETGTGKELIAGAIHHNSARATRNFVRVNCAALQENLLESELFGHEKGAFTGADRQRVGRFEQADGGSLFLDEVGDMSPNTQARSSACSRNTSSSGLVAYALSGVMFASSPPPTGTWQTWSRTVISARTSTTVSTSSRSTCRPCASARKTSPSSHSSLFDVSAAS